MLTGVFGISAEDARQIIQLFTVAMIFVMRYIHRLVAYFNRKTPLIRFFYVFLCYIYCINDHHLNP